MTSLEVFLTRIREIRSAGVGTPETSYYGALENLLNDHGKKLKPKVMCLIQMQNQGCGLPDGGLFTREQYKKGSDSEPLRGQMPSRGVIEVKPPSANIEVVAESEQVQGYLAKYGQVLVTNLRQYLLLGRDANGQAVRLEAPYSLASSDSEFWELLSHPRRTAEVHEAQFSEFLARALLHAAPLTSPEDVAWFLASYARDAKARIERTDLPALQGIRSALEQALGMKFEGEKGDRFFRSTLVQTLFYGVFSAWVLWHKQNPERKERFNWHEAVWHLRVPMIRALFEQLAIPTKLGPLNLVEVMDWATAVLNRVDRPSFFEKFEEAHAVQYFYEPFLEAFDPELRKQLGVWYTPPEIVKYMVKRVDTVLRDELSIEDGLADSRVYVLDPCCGTGAYLVEVLNQISSTLQGKGIGAMAAHELKKAARERVFGFEILPAPFVVSHLQLGLELARFGAPLAESADERVAVYLTNALTGWEPPTGPKQRLIFPEMEEERDRAEQVKQNKPILVILGNPPYNGFAGVAVGEERILSDAYRVVEQVSPPEGQGLNELYVRFFRAAERKIVDGTMQGVVCFISNYSWLDGSSHTGMRERYLKAFSKVWIDNLHGDRFGSERAPDGRTSESIFAMQGTSGIQLGTAVALLSLKQNRTSQKAELLYRDFEDANAEDRRRSLLAHAAEVHPDENYKRLDPQIGLGLPFRPIQFAATYLTWAPLDELLYVCSAGVNTSRDALVVDLDRQALIGRMEKYFDSELTNAELERLAPCATKSSKRFDAAQTRAYLSHRGFLPDKVVRYAYRPFDYRYLYWEPETKLLDEKRESLFSAFMANTHFLVCREKAERQQEGTPFFSTRTMADRHLVRPGCICFAPAAENEQDTLHGAKSTSVPVRSVQYLNEVSDSIASSDYYDLLAMHALAIGYSPAFIRENVDVIRLTWPRIPLPRSEGQLRYSVSLGVAVARLLDMDTAVSGITAGALRPEIPVIAPAVGKLVSVEDFKCTAGWGHFGRDGVTMPDEGRLELREYTLAERQAIAAGAQALGLSEEDALAQLGTATYDVFINDGARWSNIPSRVWEFTIGGYQVLKKWLSYRAFGVLARPLTPGEVTELISISRRLTAILLMQPALNANYEKVKIDSYDWSGRSTR